jgi:hypothetical protein
MQMRTQRQAVRRGLFDYQCALLNCAIGEEVAVEIRAYRMPGYANAQSLKAFSLVFNDGHTISRACGEDGSLSPLPAIEGKVCKCATPRRRFRRFATRLAHRVIFALV